MKKISLRRLIKQAASFDLMVDRGKPPAERIAHEKRAMQRRLQDQGCSRTEAQAQHEGSVQ